MIDEQTREILKYIGKRFSFYRERAGLSRVAAADRLCITPRTLAAYERGEREISAQMTVRMAQIYGVTLTKLTDYKNIMQNIHSDDLKAADI